MSRCSPGRSVHRRSELEDRWFAEVVALSAADEARALGDTLPVGLTLVG